MVLLHRVALGLFTFTLASVYCGKGYGVCRPIPLRSYLQGLGTHERFMMEPVSFAITLMLIAVMVIMQVCIEVRTFNARKKEQDAFEMAVGAKKSLALSKRRLQQQKNDAQEALERVRKMFTQLRYSFATLTDLVTNRINSF